MATTGEKNILSGENIIMAFFIGVNVTKKQYKKQEHSGSNFYSALLSNNLSQEQVCTTTIIYKISMLQLQLLLHKKQQQLFY